MTYAVSLRAAKGPAPCAVIFRILALLLISIPGCFADQIGSITIHTVSGPSTTAPGWITVQYSYDGSYGKVLHMAARAVGGSDFDIQSLGVYPVELSKGEHRTARMALLSPSGEVAFRTDRIEVFVYAGDAFPFMRKIVDRPIEWPAAPNSGNHLLDGFVNAYDVDDYEEAERVFDLWSRIDAVDQNGDQKLRHYLSGTEIRFSRDREGSIAKIRAWRSARPNSVAAILTEAWFWIAYAEHLHGWKSPDADTRAVIRQYQANAANILKRTKPLTGKHLLWQLLQLKMAINAEQGGKSITAAFESAIRAHPSYADLYVEAAGYLAKGDAPGRWRDINAIADQLDRAVSATNPGAYAILIDHAADVASGTMPDPFTTGVTSWPRARDSWKALVERYPSAINLNRYASRACQAGDKDTFQTVLGKIGKRVIPEAWPANRSLDLCRRRFLRNS